jgi:hypothetical protein
MVTATESQPMQFASYLHAVSLSTGEDLQTPVQIAPSAYLSNGSTLTYQNQYQYSRAGLAWANNSIYIGIGSHCDNDATSISGWLLRYNTSLSLENSFHTIDVSSHVYELASIWMSGFAPAADSSGNLYVVTGNGSFDIASGGQNYGQSALKLSPTLTSMLSYFTPASYNTLNGSDTDFGSGGIMLLPAVSGTTTPLAVAMGKDATLYLLNGNALGGETTGDSGALQATRVATSGDGVWGGPAYYGGSTASTSGPTVYYQTSYDVLRAYRLATSPSLKLSQLATGTSTAGYGGSTPIVSSNGNTPNTGIVWLVRRMSTVQLEAYNADTLGAPIFAASAGTWSNKENNAFVTPLEANGRVYVGATGTVSVFGLTTAP